MNDKPQSAIAAEKAILKQINSDWSKLQTVSENIKEETIAAVNLVRKIGLGFQGLCGHEQITFSFWMGIKDKLPKGMEFEAAKKCVNMARNLDGPVNDLFEATRAMQDVFVLSGFLELPERSEAQKANSITPVTLFFTLFAKAKDQLEKKLADVTKWDADTREAVRCEISRHELWLVTIKERL